MFTKQIFLVSTFTAIWHTMPTLSPFNLLINVWKSFDCKWWNLIHECTECSWKTIYNHFKFFLLCFLFAEHWFPWVANTCIMENEASGLIDSFVARHTIDPILRSDLLSRNQNGSRPDQGTRMGVEVKKTEYIIAYRWGEGHWYCFSATT